jgi:O-antigen ligase
LFLNNLGNYILPFTLLSTFITLLFSPVGITAVLRAIGFWIVALVIFKFYQVLAQKDQQRILELLILTFALYFIISFLFLFLPGISAFKFGRFKGLMGNPNGLGLLGLFCYGVINLIRSKQETSFKNGFFVRLNLLILVLIILTGSRTALFCVIVFELVSRLIKNKVLLILSLLSVSVLYVFINTIPLDTLIDSLGFSDYLRAESIQNASGRTDVWPVAWEEIKNHPWLGNGIMYDDYFITDYAKRTFGDIADRQWGGVWSSYLSLLLDVGVIGFFAYVYFNMKVYKKAINKSLGLAFLAMCVFSGFTESWMASSMNAFTPMMFLFWAIQAQPVITNKN